MGLMLLWRSIEIMLVSIQNMDIIYFRNPDQGVWFGCILKDQILHRLKLLLAKSKYQVGLHGGYRNLPFREGPVWTGFPKIYLDFRNILFKSVELPYRKLQIKVVEVKLINIACVAIN